MAKQTFKYRFVKSLIENGIKTFRMKHVLAWHKMANYDKRTFTYQAYQNIINPLLKAEFITRESTGKYKLIDDAAIRLEELRARKTGKKPDAEEDVVVMKLGLPKVNPIFITIQEDEKERDEWDTYISKKMKRNSKD